MRWRKGGREISSWYVLVDRSYTATCVWLASRLGVETVRVEIYPSPCKSFAGPCAPSEHSLFAVGGGGGRLLCRFRLGGQTAQLRRQRVPAIQLATTTTAGAALRTFASHSRAKTLMSKMPADHWKETFTKLVFVGIIARLARICFSFLVLPRLARHMLLSFRTHTTHGTPCTTMTMTSPCMWRLSCISQRTYYSR